MTTKTTRPVLTLTDLAGAPLITIDPSDADHRLSVDRQGVYTICDLCREKPGRMALGYHPGVFCTSCLNFIWTEQATLDNEGNGCRCPDWTLLARDMHLKVINRRIADPRDEYNEADADAIWTCSYGVGS
jgi:hypothetical protein